MESSIHSKHKTGGKKDSTEGKQWCQSPALVASVVFISYLKPFPTLLKSMVLRTRNDNLHALVYVKAS
jgi:hypothetical protein